MTTVPEHLRVLLVEDAATMRRIEKQILSELGCSEVIEAEDGSVAVKKLEGGAEVDLIVSDWNMPNMGGYELLQWVRASARHRHIPFIMATAQSDSQQARKAEQAGVSGFIPKPFGAEELRRKIDQVFSATGEKAAPVSRGPRKSASGKALLRVAHLQITDHILLGVLKDMIAHGELSPRHFELETHCMGGWNPVRNAMETGEVDAAFILAPLAMDLFRAGAPLKMTLLAHRNGSRFVRNREGGYDPPFEGFFRKKSVLIPHKLSVHHMLIHVFLTLIGLKASLEKGTDVDVNLEVVAPVDMPRFLQENNDVGGFVVADPVGSRAVEAGLAREVFRSSEVWQDHPCCVVAVRDDFSEAYREAVYEFVEFLVQAGRFVEAEPEIASQITLDFLDPAKKLGLQADLVRKVLTDPEGITTTDLYPAREDLERLQRYFTEFLGLGPPIDLDRFIDARYADMACGPSVVRSAESFCSRREAEEMLRRSAAGEAPAPEGAPAFPPLRIHRWGGRYHFSLETATGS